jgi:glycosyltransferase involved in cell wall biosynthesis
MPDAWPQTLTVVIPALNEEEAIGTTVRRCLDARQNIKRAAGLNHVEVIVVSDGSTDRTAEIARAFDEVDVIEFEINRGYGAAIKEGFRQGKGSIVGFIDADGTCDPVYFAEMCRIVVEEGADVVLGSRLGPSSKMPRIRKLGNRIFALTLGLLCGRRVTDTASGMRVVRRKALAELYPLPDRMHFTPAMSARALLNGLRVVELPMHYEERIGTSKLSVLGDGVRFLKTILDGVLCYRPERLFLMAFVACVVIATLLGLMPLEYYLSNRSLQEWMIYRLVICLFLGLIGFMLLSATSITWQTWAPSSATARGFGLPSWLNSSRARPWRPSSSQQQLLPSRCSGRGSSSSSLRPTSPCTGRASWSEPLDCCWSSTP